GHGGGAWIRSRHDAAKRDAKQSIQRTVSFVWSGGREKSAHGWAWWRAWTLKAASERGMQRSSDHGSQKSRHARFQPAIEARRGGAADGDEPEARPLVAVGRGLVGPHGVHAGFDFFVRATRAGQAEAQLIERVVTQWPVADQHQTGAGEIADAADVLAADAVAYLDGNRGRFSRGAATFVVHVAESVVSLVLPNLRNPAISAFHARSIIPPSWFGRTRTWPRAIIRAICSSVRSGDAVPRALTTRQRPLDGVYHASLRAAFWPCWLRVNSNQLPNGRAFRVSSARRSLDVSGNLRGPGCVGPASPSPGLWRDFSRISNSVWVGVGVLPAAGGCCGNSSA